MWNVARCQRAKYIVIETPSACNIPISSPMCDELVPRVLR